MPRPYYDHNCSGRPVVLSSPVCFACGEETEFGVWGLTKHEAMGRYQYVYGLKPLGLHREFWDQLLYDLRDVCPRCHGVGILSAESRQGWRTCPVCEATGGFWRVSQEHVDHLRDEIVREFPEARARQLTTFLEAGLVFDAVSGEMTSLPTVEEVL